MRKKYKHVIVLSYDSLSSFDFEQIKNLPNFKKLLKKSFFCPYVESVYPSLTYPAHVSITTGKLPFEHGVINNTFRQYDSADPDWFWIRKLIKGDTLFDLASSAGRSVAALLWPVTGKAKMKFNMPEVFPNRWWRNQIVLSLLNGSPFFQIKMNSKYGYLRDGKRQPGLDDFTHRVLLDVIKEEKPGLIMAHFTDLDTHRHLHGTFSSEANAAILRHDERLGEVLMLLDKEDMLEDTALVVLGDHASIDTSYAIKLNVLLREKGFININERGQLTSFSYIAKSCDGSAYIYKNPDAENTEEKDIKLLIKTIEEFQRESDSIEEIIPKKRAAELGFDPECEFVIEAKKGYYFMDGFLGDAIESVEGKTGYGSHYMKSTHGYLPKKSEYGTVFFVSTDLEEVMYPTVKKPIALKSLNDFIKTETQDEEGTGEGEVDYDDYDDGVELENVKLTDEFNVIKELLGLK